MLSENIYVNDDGYNMSEVSESWIFVWICPECGEEFTITKDNIEDFTDSDPHDPLQDYFICPDCEHAIGLFKGIDGKVDDEPARIWADGSFVYLSSVRGDERIV